MPQAWPGSLQELLNVDSFGIQFGNTLVRSDMDVGLAKVRSRYTSAIDVYTSSIDMDIDDFTTLSDFYKTTLNNGALTFNFDNPMTGDEEEYRFLEPPDVRPMGGRYFKVSMKWEKIP